MELARFGKRLGDTSTKFVESKAMGTETEAYLEQGASLRDERWRCGERLQILRARPKEASQMRPEECQRHERASSAGLDVVHGCNEGANVMRRCTERCSRLRRGLRLGVNGGNADDDIGGLTGEGIEDSEAAGCRGGCVRLDR